MELTDKMIEQLKADLSEAKNYDDLMGKNEAIKNFFPGHSKKCLKAN